MSAYLFAGVVVTGAWTHLDEIGWPAWLLLAFAFAFDHWRSVFTAAASERRMLPADRTHLFPGRPTWRAVLIGVVISMPVLIHVGLTLREEFGFGGDEGYHLSATRTFALYFRRAGPLLAAIVAALWIVSRFHRRYLLTLSMAALFAASHWLDPQLIFGRYPAGFYLISTPLNVAFEVIGFPYPFAANHVVNALSVPVWLFVLRPIILRRWPDASVLPVALLVFFQPLALVYAGGGMLEPWAVVFLLLAIEGVLVLPAADKWIAVLLAGTATFFKETAILLVPAVWLLAMGPASFLRVSKPVLRRGAIALGAVAVAPFVIYIFVRRHFAIEREFIVADPATVWAPSRAFEWIANVQYQLGTGGLIVVGALAAWTAIGLWFWRRDPQRWRHHAAWTATTVALILFFYIDTASLQYTGYGRFLAYPLLALAGILFIAADRLAVANRRALVVIAAAIFALQLAPTVRMLALDLRPDYGRNAVEWSRSLIRLPIRALARQMPLQPTGSDIRRIRIIAFAIDLISTRVAYPDLADRYEMVLEDQIAASPDCRCRDRAEAVLAGFELAANFDRKRPAGGLADGEAACVQQARATCLATVIERHDDGRIVGVLGTGVR